LRVARVFAFSALVITIPTWVWAFLGWGLSKDQAANLAGLASNVLGGAVVAGVVLLLESQMRARDLVREEQEKVEADRRRLHLQIAVHANPAQLNLIGTDLSGIRLPHKNLSGANLTQCNLEGADLQSAKLVAVRFIEANMDSCILTQADLTRSDLSQARLRGAVLTLAQATGATLNGADLSAAQLSGVDLSNSSLVRANLSGADLTGADLRGANLHDAVLTGATIAQIIRDEHTIGLDRVGGTA
jgi:uncharacterized protein YjbI with pentapeptide repeats